VSKLNICSSKQIAEADFDGQNGRSYDRDIRMATPCKAKKKKAKPACKTAKQKRGKACKRRN
jgi:hypothetical protein